MNHSLLACWYSIGGYCQRFEQSNENYSELAKTFGHIQVLAVDLAPVDVETSQYSQADILDKSSEDSATPPPCVMLPPTFEMSSFDIMKANVS